jgi:uncharacterized membrane protein
MAGISLGLRKINRSNELLGPLTSFSNATVVAAGPWIYTALAIAAVTEVTHPMVSRDALMDFTVILAHVFSLSLVVTAPVLMIGMRVLADDLYSDFHGDIRGLFVLSLLFASVLSAGIAATLFIFVWNTPAWIAAIGIAGTAVASMLWIALGFVGAMRQYGHVSFAFAAGLVLGTILTALAALFELGIEWMVATFLLGFLVIFVALSRRLLTIFEQPCLSLHPAAGKMLQRLRSDPELAVGALAGSAGIWMDKWVAWSSEFGLATVVGLRHAPLYDAPIFISNLTVVPALALFVTALETTFLRQYRGFTAAIDGHATLWSIERHASELKQATSRTLAGIIFLQGVMCMILFLAAPNIVERSGLQFQQVEILRNGTIAALFQYIFISSSALLVFFNATRLYALLQIIFLLTVSTVTLATTGFGARYLAIGYMAASVAVGIAALLPLFFVVNTITFRVFVGSVPVQATGRRQ